MIFSIYALLFPSIGFHTEPLVPTMGTGQFSGRRGMVCPESFPEPWFEHFMTLGADIGYIVKIVVADPNSPGNRNANPEGKGPPDAGCDPQKYRCQFDGFHRQAAPSIVQRTL